VTRAGLGFDIHRLKAGRRFLLGGVEIPFNKGEVGHSDGDVLAHAVCDAILGASALGDIGELFPSSDPVYKNADSMKLLKKAYELAKKSGWMIINIDCVIICERPKILHYRDVIRKSLAETLEIPSDFIFLKGKTREGIGSIGKGKAIEAHAVCLLEKNA